MERGRCCIPDNHKPNNPAFLISATQPEVMQRLRTNIFAQAQRPSEEKKEKEEKPQHQKLKERKRKSHKPYLAKDGIQNAQCRLQKKMYTCQSPTYMLSLVLYRLNNALPENSGLVPESGVPVPVNASLRRKEQLKQFPRNRPGAKWNKTISTSTSARPDLKPVQSSRPGPVHDGSR